MDRALATLPCLSRCSNGTDPLGSQRSSLFVPLSEVVQELRKPREDGDEGQGEAHPSLIPLRSRLAFSVLPRHCSPGLPAILALLLLPYF